MSTRIGHGYRLRPGTDVLALLIEHRAQLDAVRDRLDATEVVAGAVAAIDTAVAHALPAPVDALRVSHTEIMTRRAAEDPRVVWSDPNYLSVSWGKDPKSGYIGLLVHRGHPYLQDAVAALPGVSEYGYWDSEDPPADIAPDDWATRESFWDRVIPTGRPADTMATWNHRDAGVVPLTLVLDGGAPTPLALDCVPDVDQRAAAIARRMLTRAVTRNDPDADPVSSVLSAVFALGRGEHPEVIAAARALCGPIGPLELTGVRKPRTVNLAARRARMAVAVREATDALTAKETR
ncbi:hypothetical protein [Cellulosimicrobium sp. Marseille-Q4280]|uniref:hypothetical protein n=1 Tax=Cellulosimicrobium sp. Marseille-Q4280 TaxID=2937992 RepID=UPI0020406F30|nr:hypothetical protein [Cellulosimicrobium sp. Marseille-Q4280]